MPGDNLDRLEYPRLRELLEGLATSHLGRSTFRELLPYPTRDEAEHVLSLVSGLKRMHEHGRGLPPLEIDDLQPVLVRLQIPGTVLSPEEILGFVPLLVVSRTAKEVLKTAEDFGVESLAAPLRAMPHLERAIEEVFDRDGQIKDRASPRLRTIRREREQRREKLRSRLEHMASGLGGSDSAALVTLREGRYVLSVPREQKSKVKGLVQDRSASGATFYMEPLELVEDNNALRELDAEERAEIRRIMSELTEQLRAEHEDLSTNYQETGYLDTLRARVLLALRWGGEPPAFADVPRLRIRGAKHPLLLEARGVSDDAEEAHRSVVPLDLDLDEETRILLITGPNMGGKTVALKTLGFLSAMAESGCLIPVVPGCELPWVDRWLVSLGDEQSLEQDLSTFAAHLKRWGEALEEAGPKSLVLMDELGSGTDPVEGAALAQSVLERLLAAGSLGLVTTHLGTLKAFAASEDGISNASMTFDPESQTPTYGLAVGIPGESHAMEMARHLGFPEERVERAEELLPQEERDIKELLAELDSERRQLAVQNEELHRKVEEASRIEEERKERLQRLLDERASIRARAARQAREMVRRAEETLREAKKISRTGTRPERLSRGNLAREQARLARLETPRREEVMGPRPERVEVGKWYWAETLAREVQVVQEPDGAGRVMVVREGMRVELPVETLRVITGEVGGNGDRDSRPKPRPGVPEVENPPLEIHLRGLRVDESLEQLDRALDQALLAGLKELRVIHGKGTGTLRRAVEEFCRNHAGVKSSRTGEQWEGGAGATVIELEG